jgi:CheY-like chemotaxis protein
MRILLAEDNEELAEIMVNSLELYPNCLVHWKPNGEEALAEFKLNPDYDLVITDRNMPKMDGIQLGELIHKLSPSTRIILWTSDLPDCSIDYFKEIIHKEDTLSWINNFGDNYLEN